MMSDEQIRQHFQVIRQQIAAQLGEDTAGWREVDAALEDLQVIYEQMQASLEAIEEVEAELFQRQQDYQELFQFFPIASLITNANGLILDANQAIAQLLNVPYSYLVGKPLAVFVAEKVAPVFGLISIGYLKARASKLGTRACVLGIANPF